MRVKLRMLRSLALLRIEPLRSHSSLRSVLLQDYSTVKVARTINDISGKTSGRAPVPGESVLRMRNARLGSTDPDFGVFGAGKTREVFARVEARVIRLITITGDAKECRVGLTVDGSPLYSSKLPAEPTVKYHMALSPLLALPPRQIHLPRLDYAFP